MSASSSTRVFDGSFIIVNSLEREEALKLRGIAAREDIEDTRSLVTAYNEARDNDERKLFRCWLRVCIDYAYLKFESFDDDMIEYCAALAEINVRCIEDAKLIRSLLTKLCNSVISCQLLNKSSIAALEHVLSIAKGEVLNDTADYLLKLREVFQNKLEAQEEFSRRSYGTLGAVIFALHRTVVKLNEVGKKLLTRQGNEKVASTMKHVERNQAYFPFYFHSRQVRLSIKEFEKTQEFNALIELGRFGCYLAAGLLYIAQGVVALKTINLDVDAFRNAAGFMKKWADGINGRNLKWDQQLKEIHKAALEGLDGNTLEPIKELYRKKKEKRKRLQKKEEKMLEFGLIVELNFIAISRETKQLRNEAQNWLLDHALYYSSQGRNQDPDIFEALLDSLYNMHRTSSDREKTTDALRVLASSTSPKLKAKVDAWKGEESLHEKLNALTSESESEKSKTDTFFDTIREVMGLNLTYDKIQINLKCLKEHYKCKTFLKTVALFEAENNSKHLKDLECVVYQYQENSQEQRFIQAEGMLDHLIKQEAKHMVIVGNPGTGKTCFCKKIVYLWANEESCNNFKAIYFVPVMKLNNMEDFREGEKGALADEIMKCCFSHPRSQEHKTNKTQVLDDLEKISTLLILDGCEDANEFGKGLLRSFLQLDCKILLTSRPCVYVTELQEESISMMHCAGFNDEQLATFIQSELSSLKCQLELIFQQRPSLREAMRVPFIAATVGIHLKENLVGSEECTLPVEKLQDIIVNNVWERYSKKSTAPHFPEKLKVFKALSIIAGFQMKSHLQRGIGPSSMMMRIENSCSIEELENCGFMVFGMENRFYNFACNLFREYFNEQDKRNLSRPPTLPTESE